MSNENAGVLTVSDPSVVSATGNGTAHPVDTAVRRICITGFADSRDQAPFADPSWEIWGVNDLYAHVPRVDVTFEVHHLLGLGNRRNPQHEAFLRAGKHPVWMTAAHADFPSARAVPYDELIARFPRSYFTNSISIMLAMAILEISGNASWQPMKYARGEIALFGVDMAAQTEYGSQRPSCEYFIGIADGLGIPVHIPDNSDLCKTTALYGLSTTAPLRIKLQSRMDHLRKSKVGVMQQLAAIEGQRQTLQSQLDGIRGQMAALEYIEGVWTMPTDIPTGAIVPAKDRTVSSSAAGGNGHSELTELVKGG